MSAAPSSCGDPLWDAYISRNTAVDKGLRALNNWAFAPYVFSSLNTDVQPAQAVGLGLDWGGALGTFTRLGAHTSEEGQREAMAQLQRTLGAVVEGCQVSHPLQACFAFLIDALERHLEAKEPQILGALTTLVRLPLAGSAPLLQDAAAYCGCAIICQWARLQQPECSGEIIEFLAAVCDLVQRLGAAARATLPAAEPLVPADMGTAPACRAASVVNAAFAVADRLFMPFSTINLDLRQVFARILLAACSLAPLFEAPPGQLLSGWQATSLIWAANAFKIIPSIGKMVAARGQTAARADVGRRLLAPVALRQVMLGLLTFIRCLSGPYHAALSHPEHEGAAAQQRAIGAMMSLCTSSVRLLLRHRHNVADFIQGGGVSILLGHLAHYAAVQGRLSQQAAAGTALAGSVAAVHDTAHLSAQKCLLSMFGLLFLQREQPAAPLAGDMRVPDLCVAANAVPTLVALLASSPSLGTTIASCAHRRELHQWSTVQLALIVLEQLCRTSLDCRLGLLVPLQPGKSADGLKEVVWRATHLADGVPVGTHGRAWLAAHAPVALHSPEAAAIAAELVRGWARPCLGIFSHLVQAPMSRQSSGGAGVAETVADQVWTRLRQLLSPSELTGLLTWQPGGSDAAAYVEKAGISAFKEGLEDVLLGLLSAMVQKFPGIEKVLAREEGFLLSLAELIGPISLDQRMPLEGPQGMPTRINALQLMKAMVKRCEKDFVFKLNQEGVSLMSRLLGLCIGVFRSAWEQEGVLEEQLVALAGRAGRERRRALEQQFAQEAAPLVELVQEASLLVEAMLEEEEFCRGWGACNKMINVWEGLMQIISTAQRSRVEGIKAAADRCKACFWRAARLADHGMAEDNHLRMQAAAEAAAEAADAHAAALLAEEEAAQQAAEARAAKRARQKAARAAKQAQQERERAAREEQAEAQRRERERAAAEAAARQRQERERREAEAAAAARATEEEAAARRAEAKAAKRARQKAARAAKQAQQAEQQDSLHSAPGRSATAQLAAGPEAGPTAATGSGTPEALRLVGQPHTPEQAEARATVPGSSGAAAQGAATGEEEEEEFQALMALLLPGRQPNSAPAEPSVQQSPVAQAAAAAVPLAAAGPATQAVAAAAPPAAAGPATQAVAAAAPPAAAASASGSGQGWSAAAAWRAAGVAAQREDDERAAALPPALAAVLRCAMIKCVLSDPVIAADGHTYERSSIEAWLAGGNRDSPATGQPLASLALRPNFAVRDLLGAGR